MRVCDDILAMLIIKMTVTFLLFHAKYIFKSLNILFFYSFNLLFFLYEYSCIDGDDIVGVG